MIQRGGWHVSDGPQADSPLVRLSPAIATRRAAGKARRHLRLDDNPAEFQVPDSNEFQADKCSIKWDRGAPHFRSNNPLQLEAR